MVWCERGNWEHYGRGKVAVAKARPSCVVWGGGGSREKVGEENEAWPSRGSSRVGRLKQQAKLQWISKSFIYDN